MKQEDHEAARRVRFYGADDLAARWQAPRVLELAAAFDPTNPPTRTMDILELHHVLQYVENRLLPDSCTQDEADRLAQMAPQIRSAVARYFSTVDDSNFASTVAEIDYEYFGDLLDLLGRSKAFERCDSATAIAALKAARIGLGVMLSCQSFVLAYDTAVRSELLLETRSAEYLVRKYLEKAARSIHLPRSLTSSDARDLLERYIDSEEANLNYVRLIATANERHELGIDPKLKLRAKRRSEELNASLFVGKDVLKTGTEVSISDDQDEPVLTNVDRSDGSIWRYTYSQRWLEQTTDHPSILNNFQHLFEFTDGLGLLTLPSYPAGLGVMERTMGLKGTHEYQIGVAFRNLDSRSLLQTHMYRRYLEQRDIDLEQVIAWFFDTYLLEEFDISDFSFNPSAADIPYLQKVRHVFAELESVSHQFKLFVENGELDRDLLAMGSDQIRYKDIPSLLDGKYIYASEGQEIAGILRLLFSDQSSLCYIDENLRANTATGLLLKNQIAYEDFHEYQRLNIDHLIGLGILQNGGTHIRFANLEQLRILSSLFHAQSANYFHLSKAGRAEADAMIGRGWAARRSSLLTNAEGEYFNYYLNRVDHGNGPNLRNKYLHGAQSASDTENVHFHAYLIALRLTLALVIKINDDVCLAATEKLGHGVRDG